MSHSEMTEFNPVRQARTKREVVNDRKNKKLPDPSTLALPTPPKNRFINESLELPNKKTKKNKGMTTLEKITCYFIIFGVVFNTLRVLLGVGV